MVTTHATLKAAAVSAAQTIVDASERDADILAISALMIHGLSRALKMTENALLLELMAWANSPARRRIQ